MTRLIEISDEDSSWLLKNLPTALASPEANRVRTALLTAAPAFKVGDWVKVEFDGVIEEIDHRVDCDYAASCNGHVWFCNKCGAHGSCSSCDDEKADLANEIVRLRDLETEYDDTFDFLLRVMRQRNHAVFAIQCFRQRALVTSELHAAITDWLIGAGFDLTPDHDLIREQPVPATKEADEIVRLRAEIETLNAVLRRVAAPNVVEYELAVVDRKAKEADRD